MSIISYPEFAHKNNLQVSSKLANRFFKSRVGIIKKQFCKHHPIG